MKPLQPTNPERQGGGLTQIRTNSLKHARLINTTHRMLQAEEQVAKKMVYTGHWGPFGRGDSGSLVVESNHFSKSKTSAPVFALDIATALSSGCESIVQ